MPSAPGVSGFRQGQRVAALTVHSGYAELLVRGASEFVPVPDDVDDVNAVALVLNYVTAYQMIHRAAQLRPGQTAPWWMAPTAAWRRRSSSCSAAPERAALPSAPPPRSIHDAIRSLGPRRSRSRLHPRWTLGTRRPCGPRSRGRLVRLWALGSDLRGGRVRSAPTKRRRNLVLPTPRLHRQRSHEAASASFLERAPQRCTSLYMAATRLCGTSSSAPIFRHRLRSTGRTLRPCPGGFHLRSSSSCSPARVPPAHASAVCVLVARSEGREGPWQMLRRPAAMRLGGCLRCAVPCTLLDRALAPCTETFLVEARHARR